MPTASWRIRVNSIRSSLTGVQFNWTLAIYAELHCSSHFQFEVSGTLSKLIWLCPIWGDRNFFFYKILSSQLFCQIFNPRIIFCNQTNCN